jgi:3',5'-cyclic AMP phosphodiesterase CpdA
VTRLSRRQFLAGGVGIAGAVGTGVALERAWSLMAREDLIPGTVPAIELLPHAWTTTADRFTFAAVGDTGSGGRQAAAVAEQMALMYRQRPFGVVAMLGDICYYGSIEDRFHDVFIRPMSPLIDADVRFELAIGNHDGGLHYSDASLDEIDAQLDRLGTPARYYAARHGPADFFYLDSSEPGFFDGGTLSQIRWLDDELASSTAQWKVVAMHHPVYSCGLHGPTARLTEFLEPVLRRHHVDLVLCGHDHNYERTVPIDGITYVVSGGGCKTTRVRPNRFTETAASTLEFMIFDIDGDRLVGEAVHVDGGVLDRFELRAREGR